MKLPTDIRERLEALIDEAIKEAVEKVDEKLKSIKTEATEILKRRYDEAVREAIEHIERVKRATEVEARKKTASAEIKARHMLLDAKERILNETINIAIKRFREVAGEGDYMRFLENLVKVAISNLGEGIILKSTEEDYERLIKIVDKLNLKGKVEVVKGDIRGYGGFIAQTPEGRSSLDFTLEYIFETQKDNVRRSISKILFGG